MNLNNETAIAWLERKRLAGMEITIETYPTGYAIYTDTNGVRLLGKGPTFWEACHAAAEAMP